MGMTLGTLINLAIYIGLVVPGALLGSRKTLRSLSKDGWSREASFRRVSILPLRQAQVYMVHAWRYNEGVFQGGAL